jgi:hypothetical protein
MAESLRIWRIYAGEDGRSRLEPLDVPLGSSRHGLVSKLFKATGVDLHRQSPGHSADWHTAPRRQLIATLTGEAEIECGDGQVLRCRPGVIHLVEDTTGQGHITRVVGTEDRVSVFIPLAEGEPLP